MVAENMEVELLLLMRLLVVKPCRPLQGISQNLLQNNLGFPVSCFQLIMAFAHSYSCSPVFLD